MTDFEKAIRVIELRIKLTNNMQMSLQKRTLLAELQVIMLCFKRIQEGKSLDLGGN